MVNRSKNETDISQAEHEVNAPSGEKNESAATGSASSVSRMLDILDLFTLDRTVIQVETVGEQLGVGRSTCYRYLQELCDSGLLMQQGKGRYALGPRIVELERLLQRSDPLLNAGKQVMENLQHVYDNRALLLCSLYKEKVLCIHQTGTTLIRHAGKVMPIFRDRGSSFPLFQGAGSQAILAYLPPHQIRALYLARQEEIAQAQFAESWAQFRSTLTSIRKQGYVATVGKRNPKVLALGVPIIDKSKQAIGSLLLLSQNTPAERAAVLALVPELQNQCEKIAQLRSEYAQAPLRSHFASSDRPL